ncbi:MAG: hypothetical protein IJH94_04430 [Clostridia bacterium]|nr:hypothetical protein [Clostridia bacterium]
MNALHSTWTKPHRYSTGGFFIEDFDILTTILSALKWRELNGRIKMVTDSVGLEFYRSRGMLGIWDEVTTELDELPQAVDPEVFWAAGKLYALERAAIPTAMLDTDFIVWERIAFDKLGDLTVIHREDITPHTYPDISAFKMKDGYSLDTVLDIYERPVNAAFYVIKNEALKNEYIRATKEFIEKSAGKDRLTYMVFAEQRLLAMTAKKMNIEIGEFSDMERLFRDGARAFTHIWGMKEQMRRSPELRRGFCLRCVRRILTEFPQYEGVLRSIDELTPYID